MSEQPTAGPSRIELQIESKKFNVAPGSSVTIPFEIFDGVRGDISLIIYNVLGRMVMDLRSQVRDAMSRQASGPYEVIWNAKDINGKDCSSGVYIIILQWGVHRQLRKIALLR